jgi:methionyl-tRNA formyltransferase
VYAIGDLAAPDTCALFAQLAPDLGCAACFPARIPPELLTIPHAGFLNLHPALLPRHRGPAPLFWTMQAGELRTGVTVHWMDAGFDTGPIALQQVLELPEGVGYSRADQQLWEAGALLLVEALNAHATGMLARRAQPPEASYEPWPGQADFTLDPTWSARRAFIFMRGVAEWGHPFHLRASTATLEVAHAIGYNPTGQLGAAFQIADDQIHIQFTPGILHARGLLR